MLSHTLRLPVFGTLTLLLKSHSNADGSDPAFSHVLAEASRSPAISDKEKPMIGNWKTAMIGLVFSAGAFAGTAAPASAATVSEASGMSVSAAASQTFIGVGGATRQAQAIALARNDGFNQARAAGASGCTAGPPEVDTSDPYFFVATVEVTCTS